MSERDSRPLAWSNVLRVVQNSKGRERLAMLRGSAGITPCQALLKRNRVGLSTVLSRLEDWYEFNAPRSPDRAPLKNLRRQLEGAH